MPTVLHAFFALGSVLVAIRIFTAWHRSIKVPAIGKISWFTVLFPITDLKALTNARDKLIEGAARYPDGWFKIQLFPFGEVAIVNGPTLLNELRNAPEDALSFAEFANRTIQIPHTIGPNLITSRYHVPIVRTTLTRNLGALFPDLMDEMTLAFKESVLNLENKNGWTDVHAYSTIQGIVCRTTNRLVVGAPLCRNEEYRELNVKFTIDVAGTAAKINLWPSFLHPIIGPFLSKTKEYQSKLLRLAGPMIEERKMIIARDGKNANLPNDYLTWLLQDAPAGFEQTTEGWVIRILQINFAAIHTSSMTFTHALYHLAAQPEYIKVLRDEVDAVIESEGWSKASIQKLKHVDSFLRESSRLNSVALTSLNRYAVRDYTFQDGTLVPKGTLVTANLYSLHMDDNNYENAATFDPWRFVSKRGEEGEENKHQLVHTTPEYLAFGFGKHACPGRFFAANEVKAMLAYFVQNYDVKLPEGIKDRPANTYFGTNVAPNQLAHISFRPRQKA